MSPLIRSRFSGHIFGGILYLRQRGTKDPLLAEFLDNDVLKGCILQVITIDRFDPSPRSRGRSEQGESCFHYTNNSKLSQRNIAAWTIIDKVYQQVECKDLKVDVVGPELTTTAWKRFGSKRGKSKGHLFFSLFR